MHALHRELRLVGAEAAERAAHRVVGAHGDATRTSIVGHVVRPAGVAGGPLEHLHADAGVRRPSRRSPRTSQRGQRAVGVAAGPVLQADRVALGVDQQALLARQRALHRPLQQPGGSAVCAWLLMSSLPPNAPPLETSSTVTCVVGRRRAREAIWLRSSHTPWPPEYTCRVAAVGDRARRACDSGSRKACSMRWVWNTSCTVWALAGERGVDVAAARTR